MRRRFGLLIVVVLAASGCASERFARNAEIERFTKTVAARTAAADLRPGRVLTLAECETLALDNNLAYRVEVLAAKLADPEVGIALSRLLPRGDATLRFTTRSNEPLTEASPGQSFAFEDKTQETFHLSVILPIFDYGASYMAWRIAKDERTQSLLAILGARNALLRDVRSAYVRLDGAQREASLVRAEVDASLEELRAARALEREGFTTPADTAFVEAALARAERDLALAGRTTAVARSALCRTLSVPVWSEFGIAGQDIGDPDVPTSAEAVRALEDGALRRRPEPRSQDHARNIAAAKVHQATAELFPRLDGIFSFDWLSSSKLVNPSFVTAGATIGHALLDGGATLSRLERAEAGTAVEEERAILVAMGVVYDVDVRVLEMLRASDALAADRRVEAAAERLLDEVRGRHREGLAGGADLSRALADLHAARRQSSRTRTELRVAGIELRRAAGFDLEGAVERLDDEAETAP